MKNLLTFLFLLTIVFSGTTKGQTINVHPMDTTLQLLTYGLQHPLYRNAQNLVASQYGFKYHTVAGCVVSKTLVDSVEKVNAVVKAKLEARYGKDFFTRFEKIAAEEFKRQQEVEQVILKHPVIKAKKKALEGAGSGLYFYLDWTNDKTGYAVVAHGQVSLHNEEWFVNRYFMLKVDSKTREVLIIDEKVEKQKMDVNW